MDVSAAQWPTTTKARLERWQLLVGQIRCYFAEHHCLEVTTPILSRQASSEPALTNLSINFASAKSHWYLRTSPESAMKRLLATGSGDIYQIGPAFRADECGPRHRPEFTLLEWYRVARTHHQLMDEVEALVRALGLTCPIARLCYTDIFADAFGAPAQSLATTQLADLARRHGLELGAADRDDRALLLDGLFVQVIEPRLALEGALFLYDYPPELRAYARLSAHEPQVAERFELIIDGLEIANGYHEITDRAEQAACFEAENALRARRQLPQVAADEGWLAALSCGLPSCAGVALGVERLMMALHGLCDIAEVLGCDELI